MKPKRILIVDDESLARQRVRRFLQEETNHRFTIEEATNGLEALEHIRSFQPEIVFLDIQMPGMDGFEVLQNIEKRDFRFIFQTAFDSFAVKAFDESASDYLLKPLSKERFSKALAKVLQHNNPVITVEALDQSLINQKKFLNSVTYRKGSKLIVLPVHEISYFLSQDHYTLAYTQNGEFILDLSISFLIDHLDPSQFVQTHRRAIVAIKTIRSIGGVNQSVIELQNGSEVPLARSKRKSVLALFECLN